MKTSPALKSRPPQPRDDTDRLKQLEEWTKEPAKKAEQAAREGEGRAEPAPTNKPAAAAPKSGQSGKPDTDPWGEANPDIIKIFNLRLPEDLHVRLKWLGDTSYGESMHSIATEAVAKEVAKRLKERGLK